MPDARCAALLLVAFGTAHFAFGDDSALRGPQLLETRCATCHGGAEPKGGFRVGSLGEGPDRINADLWRKSLDYVRAEVMPPAAAEGLSDADRHRLIAFLEGRIGGGDGRTGSAAGTAPRRLNNRELANSVRDVLMIEDVGTHQPLAGLVGDTLRDGFDTDGDALGLSQFHLERYIEAFRKIVDATILSGQRPRTRHYEVTADDMQLTSLSQRRRQERANRTPESIEILDPRLHVYFANFESAPATGRYRIKIQATGKDRGFYDSAATGVHDGDPIRLRIHLGDRVRTVDLPDEAPVEIALDEWVAAGTRLELSYPTDGLRLRGNGNFKFQFAIAHDHIRKTDPDLYATVLRQRLPQAPARTAANPGHWSHWTEQWRGPRPRLFGAEIEGPLYESWPPKRQVALLGAEPTVRNAAAILAPIAERAWRRAVSAEELEPIIRLVESRAAEDRSTEAAVEALKEGIVAILASPSFLLVHHGGGPPADRFASKLSYFLRSTIPDARIRAAASSGALDGFERVRAEVVRLFETGEAEDFLREFPHAWLELDRINFMAPDPDRFPLYARKRLSEDMVAEALRFFRHAIENNLPVPELLAADYTFLNADLARVYGVEDVPQDSELRKYTFQDGRRGGLLGMGAILTLTADSLSTSPIHRAVYVLEKFLGIRPAPPPADVEIAEPDVRQATTIKEVLSAHTAEPACASCHQGIDPYGYAFEHFDPVGAWRDEYTMHIAPRPSRKDLAELDEQDRLRAAQGLPPADRPWENEPIPVDATSRFPGGAPYTDIVEYRRHLLNDANRDRFVRCFIEKLLMYANGAEPDDPAEIGRILAMSAENDYQIVDTIAAAIHSPLFRSE